jgi:16S rRNA (guanine(966)-N(2))-methyltransferase RsmD
MRVITGAKRGMKLLSPAQDSPIRPTADRTKESVFNLIHDGIDGVFLDLFAGSGQMGIEALSRGAKKAVFCDNEKAATDLIRANLKKTGFTNFTVFYGDYRKYLKTTSEKFDVIFIDPPYDRGLTQRALAVIGEKDSCLNAGGTVIVECKYVETLPEEEGRLILTDRRKYGIASVLIYKSKEDMQ